MTVDIKLIRAYENNITNLLCRTFKAEGLIDIGEIITFIDSIICISPSLHKIYEKENNDSLEICIYNTDDKDIESIKSILQSDKVLQEYFSQVIIIPYNSNHKEIIKFKGE